MTDGADAYSRPTSFEAELVSIYECWRAMRHGDNDIPFWHDVDLSSLRDDAVLTEVFENPLRFRLGLAGRSIAARLNPERGGKFLDELPGGFSIISRRNALQQSVRGRPPNFDVA